MQSESDLRAEFCPTSWPLSESTCEVPSAAVAILPIPRALGHTIEAHVASAFARGYYHELSLDDFYHGHLILRGPKTEFSDDADLFNDVTMILYHTAEHDPRWDEARTPRSLLGFMDAHLEAAATRVSQRPRTFDRDGTLHEGDVINAMPELSSLDYDNARGVPDVYVQHDGETCWVDTLQFDIVPRAGGRFRDPRGQAIEMFLRCVRDPERRLIPYVDIDRNV